MDDAIDEGIPNNDKDLSDLNGHDNDNTFDEKDVKEIQDSIRDAALYGSLFDPAAMSALSPASVVSDLAEYYTASLIATPQMY
jgi:hypothetical protein